MDVIELAQGIALVLFTGGGVFVAVTLAKGLATRLAGTRHSSADMAALQHTVHRLSADVGEVLERVAELQERVDFAERLPARQKDADRLPDGSST